MDPYLMGALICVGLLIVIFVPLAGLAAVRRREPVPVVGSTHMVGRALAGARAGEVVPILLGEPLKHQKITGSVIVYDMDEYHAHFGPALPDPRQAARRRWTWNAYEADVVWNG